MSKVSGGSQSVVIETAIYEAEQQSNSSTLTDIPIVGRRGWLVGLLKYAIKPINISWSRSRFNSARRTILFELLVCVYDYEHRRRSLWPTCRLLRLGSSWRVLFG